MESRFCQSRASGGLPSLPKKSDEDKLKGKAKRQPAKKPQGERVGRGSLGAGKKPEGVGLVEGSWISKGGRKIRSDKGIKRGERGAGKGAEDDVVVMGTEDEDEGSEEEEEEEEVQPEPQAGPSRSRVDSWGDDDCIMMD
jgi:hypothetical protein